jgi:hypothetical protein
MRPMEIFDITLLIVLAVLLFLLVFLLIKERRYLFLENYFQKKKQKNKSAYFEDIKTFGSASVKGRREYLDFSGGYWGI